MTDMSSLFRLDHKVALVTGGAQGMGRMIAAGLLAKKAVERGAKPFNGSDAERGATPFPAIYGIGDSLVYFVDQKLAQKLYTEIFKIKPLKTEVSALLLKKRET